MSKQARTIQEVIERLNELNSTDREMDHAEADSLLLDALLILDHGDIVTAFQEARNRVGFWYA